MHFPLRTAARRRAPARSLSVAALLVALLALALPGSARAFGASAYPVPVIAASTTYAQVGSTVTLDGSQSWGVELSVVQTWSWDFGDGTTASGPVQQHTFTTQGQHVVVLTVTDQWGTSRSASQPIAIWGYPTAALAATPATGRGPLTVSLDASASSSPGWAVGSTALAFGDGTSATGTTASHTYTTPGQYTASFTITNILGFAATAYQTIKVTEAMAPPTNLAATSPTRGSVRLAWTNRMTTVFQTEVQRCAGASCTAFVTVGYLPSSATAYAESGLRSGSTFRYRLKITDIAGAVGVSNGASVKVR